MFGCVCLFASPHGELSSCCELLWAQALWALSCLLRRSCHAGVSSSSPVGATPTCGPSPLPQDPGRASGRVSSIPQLFPPPPTRPSLSSPWSAPGTLHARPSPTSPRRLSPWVPFLLHDPSCSVDSFFLFVLLCFCPSLSHLSLSSRAPHPNPATVPVKRQWDPSEPSHPKYPFPESVLLSSVGPEELPHPSALYVRLSVCLSVCLLFPLPFPQGSIC